jgi:hypothetical protein
MVAATHIEVRVLLVSAIGLGPGQDHCHRGTGAQAGSPGAARARVQGRRRLHRSDAAGAGQRGARSIRRLVDGGAGTVPAPTGQGRAACGRHPDRRRHGPVRRHAIIGRPGARLRRAGAGCDRRVRNGADRRRRSARITRVWPGRTGRRDRLPGGYPELHAAALSGAHRWQASMRAAHAAGVPILADAAA